MWWKRTRPETLSGSVSFRGGLPPRAEDFSYLGARGFDIETAPATDGAHWQLELRHPKLGNARLVCPREVAPIPDVLVEHDARLSDGEKELARLPHRLVSIDLEVPGDNVLADRKRLVRVLRAVMGDDGLIAMDHTAQAFWARAALDLELLHDADLDILGLFTAHVLTNDADRSYWLHTHGFKELGFVDFDVMYPPDEVGNAWDAVRALAYAVVEGHLRAGGRSHPIVGGAPPACLVQSQEFLEQVGHEYPEWSASLDQDHTDGHAVVCNARKTGLRAWFGNKPQRWSVLEGPLGDNPAIMFSDAATELTSTRARGTWPMLGELRSELEPFGCVTLAKLKFVGPNGSEHLWFEVHEIKPDSVDATLTNEPWQDIGVQAGERGTHSLERLSDWVVMTPAGMLSPCHLTALRTLREKREEILQALAEPSDDQ